MKGLAGIDEILGEWVETLRRGEKINPAYVIRNHPDVADELLRRLAAMDLLTAADHRPSSPEELRVLPVNRYADFQLTGEGGMGIVYGALDTDLNRQVAFKIVRPDSLTGAGAPATPGQLAVPKKGTRAGRLFESLGARFLQEAWITAGLEHPGIVPVYELGTTSEGVPCYTMRFVKGNRSLATALAEVKDKAIEERLSLLEPFLRVCDTIRYAHAHGVIHRDIKPDNVALGEFGEAVVLDWGLAKMREEEDALSETWQEHLREYRESSDLKTLANAMGTPGYISPEAAMGHVGELDERSDIYALGAILFEVLTGRLPFLFESYRELVNQLRKEAPPEARDLDPTVPEELSTLCARALAPRKGDRFSSVEEFSTAIREWQIQAATEREIAELLSEARRAQKIAERLDGEAWQQQLDRAAAAYAQVLNRRPGHAAAMRRMEILEGQRERGIRKRELAARKKVVAHWGILVLVSAVVAALIVAGIIEKGRRQAIEAERAARMSERLAVLERGRARQQVTAARVSLAGAYAQFSGALLGEGRGGAARVAATRSLVAARTTSGKRSLVEALSAWAAPARWIVGGVRGRPALFSSDGRRLYSGRTWDNSIRVWDLSGGRAVRHLEGHTAAIHSLALSADEARLYSAGADRTIRVWDLQGGRQIARLEGHRAGIRSLSLCADGSRLFSADEEGVVKVWDGESLQEVGSLSVGNVPAIRLSVSRDGSRIAVGGGTGKIRVLDVASHEVVGRYATERAFALSADGRRLFRLGEEKVTVFDLESGEAGEILEVPEGPLGLVLNGDGSALAVAGKETVRIYDVSHPGGGRLLSEFDGRLVEDGSIEEIHAGPDGSSVWWISAPQRAEGLDSLPRVAVRSLAGGPVREVPDLPDPRSPLALAASREHLFSLNGKGDLTVWSRATGMAIAVVREAHPEPSRSPTGCLAVAPDGGRLFTGGEDGEIRCWDMVQRELLDAWRIAGGPIDVLHLTADGRTLCVRSRSGAVRILDSRSGAVRGEIEDLPPGRCRFAPDGTRVYVGDEEGIRVWDLATGLEERVCDEGGERFSISGDGLRVAVPSDREIAVFEVAGGERVRTVALTGGVPRDAFLSPDGGRLFGTAGPTGLPIRVWDVGTGQRLGALGGEFPYRGAQTLSPDGTRLFCLVGRSENVAAIREWRLDVRPEIRPLLTAGTGPRDVTALGLSRGGERLCWAGRPGGGGEPAVHVWDAIRDIDLGGFGDGGFVGRLAISPDGSRLFTSDRAGPDGERCRIRCRDLRSGHSIGALEGHEGGIEALHVSSDGRRLFSVGGGGPPGTGENEIRIWDVWRFRLVREIRMPGRRVAAVAVSPDERRLFVLDHGVVAPGGLNVMRIQACDIETGERETLVEGTDVLAFVPTPDGRRLACATGAGLVLLDAVTGLVEVKGTPRRPEPGRGGAARASRIAISRDGRLIATGHESGGEETRIRLWDSESGEMLAEFPALHEGGLSGLILSADGRVLYTSGSRGVRRWSLSQLLGEPARRLANAGARYGVSVDDFEVRPDSTFSLR